MMRDDVANKLIRALGDNTRAVDRNTKIVGKLVSEGDKKASRDARRIELLSRVPYSRQQLKALKRQDLVMLAAGLGVKETSVPQTQLVESVMRVQ